MKHLQHLTLTLLFIVTATTTATSNISWYRHVSHNGKYIAFMKENKLRVYDTSNGQMTFSHDAAKDINSFAFSHSEEFIALITDEYDMSNFRIADGSLVWGSKLSDFLTLTEENLGSWITFSYSDESIVAFDLIKYSGFKRYVVIYELDGFSGELIGYQDETRYQSDDNTLGNIEHIFIDKFDNIYALETGFNSLNEVSARHSKDGELQMSGSRGYGPGFGSIKDFANGYEMMYLVTFIEEKKKYNLQFDTEVLVPKIKPDDRNGYKIKASANQQYILILTDGEATISKFNDYGGFVDRKFEIRDDYSKATIIKSHSFPLNVGELEIVFWNGKQIIAADMEKFQFETFNPENGEKFGSYSIAPDFEYSGTSISKGINAKETGVFFRDDFDDNENGWEVRSDLENFQGTIDGGSFKLKKGGSGYITTGNESMGADPYRDFQIEMVIKGSGGNYGLYWGGDDASQHKNQLLINSSGQYAFAKSGKDHKILNQLAWNDGNVKTDDFNNIKITYRGGVFGYELNGEIINSTLIGGNYSSRVGLIHQGNADVQVDKIKLTYLSDNKLDRNRFIYVDFVQPREWIKLSHEGGKGRMVNGALVIENTSNSRIWPGIEGMVLDNQLDYELQFSVKMDGPTSAFGGIRVSGKSHLHDGMKFGINSFGEYVAGYEKFSAKSGAFKSGEFNKLTIIKVRGKTSFYLNGTLVHYEINKSFDKKGKPNPKYIGFHVPENSKLTIGSIRATYLREGTMRGSNCELYVAYNYALEISSQPYACKSVPIFNGDNSLHFKWTSENKIVFEAYDTMDEYNLKWGNKPGKGGLKAPLKCSRPCRL